MIMRSLIDIEDALCATLKPYGISLWVLNAYDRDSLIIRLYHKVTEKVHIIEIDRFSMRELQDLTPITDMVMNSVMVKMCRTKWHKKRLT